MIRENVSLLQTADRPRQCDRDRQKIGVNTVVQFPCPNTQVELPPSRPPLTPEPIQQLLPKSSPTQSDAKSIRDRW